MKKFLKASTLILLCASLVVPAFAQARAKRPTVHLTQF